MTLPHWSAYQDLMAEMAHAMRGAGRILDAGCGSGVLAEHLVRQGALVEGVDASVDMARLARTRARRLGGALRVSVQDATALRFPDGSFDGVVSSNVYFAVVDPARYLAELHRVLRVGGRLAITAPTPRAASRVKILGRDLRRQLERHGLATALRGELATVMETNDAMARQGFGRTCTAAQMADLLAALGFCVDEQHERLYREALLFVKATKR
jgi:ubiquinone/menaquinone biosynthesis C-methylase UbiE